jgi:uncharacterized membrane protein YeaQ/YmgE (transglycosylase-associated protein family)
MSATIGFGILVISTAGLAWIAEELLPQRPTGGMKGLLILGLVAGFFFGWLAAELRIPLGPSPRGVSIVAGLIGSAGAIMVAALGTLNKRKTEQRRDDAS